MKNIWIYLGLCITLAGCQQAEDAEFANSADRSAATTEESVAFENAQGNGETEANAKIMAPTPGGEAELPSQKQFIRTADARFKVKDVQQTVKEIENDLAKFGGFISSNNISSQVQNTHTVKVSPDSSLLLTRFQVEGTLTLRVPNQHLDTLVHLLAPHMLFLNNHTLTADEVSLQLLQQQLAQQRHQEYVERISETIKEKPGKILDATVAENARLQKQQQADAALLARMGLNDRISYSTLTLQLYESPKLSRELVVNPDAAEQIKPYQPGFFTKVSTAAAEGWSILEWLLLVLVRFWGVLLLLACGWALLLVFRKWQTQF